MAEDARAVNAKGRMDAYEDKLKRRKISREKNKGTYKEGGSSASGVKRGGTDIEEREVNRCIEWEKYQHGEDT